MTFALVANGGGVGSAAIADTSGANLIVIAVSHDNVPTVSDNKGNTWTPLTDTSGADTQQRLYYCYNPTVGAGHTFSLSFSYEYMAVAAFSGAAASPFDVENGSARVASVTTLSPGSVTPGSNNELLVTGLALGDNGASPTVGSSFTITDSANGVFGTAYGGGLAYKIQTTAGAENPAWSWTSAATASTRIATFKAAAGGTSHASSGGLAGGSAVIAGTAARTSTHASSGGLAGQAATIAGTARVTRTHASSGGLAGGSAVIAGTANRTRVHAGTGGPSGGSAVIAGTAARTRVHDATGGPSGSAATIAGTATHVAAPGHVASGGLAGGSAVIAGTATHFGNHPTSTAALVAGSASLAGTAARAPGVVPHLALGALVAGSAAIAGTARVTRTHVATGGLVAGSAQINGNAAHPIPGAQSSTALKLLVLGGPPCAYYQR